MSNAEYHKQLNDLLDSLEEEMQRAADSAAAAVNGSTLNGGDKTELVAVIKKQRYAVHVALDDYEKTVCSRLGTIEEH